jgi:putative salt-induced outer membrane protein YdiY
MRYLLLTILFCAPLSASAQVLNAESLRKVTDTSGFSGSAKVRFAVKRNTKDFFTLASDLHIQYKMNKNLLLFKNNIEFQKIEGDKFENSGISHLRYNYRFHNRIAWEVFVQGQYNKISLIDFRGLAGTGPRFKLSTAENYKFYLGTLVMYEHEELADGVTPIQRDFRGSTYFSFSLYPLETISFSSTTYYQPKFSQFNDYRISSQSSLLIDIFKNFAFSIDYIFSYDTFPAVGIPNSQYDFTTGLAYSFD